MLCIGRSTAKWHIDRSSEKCSKRRGYREKYKKDVSNIERSMVYQICKLRHHKVK